LQKGRSAIELSLGQPTGSRLFLSHALCAGAEADIRAAGFKAFNRGKYHADSDKRNVSRLIVECLINEGVEYVFGVPGEENIHLVDALKPFADTFCSCKVRTGSVPSGRDVRQGFGQGRRLRRPLSTGRNQPFLA
jgi:hypothetical protein